MDRGGLGERSRGWRPSFMEIDTPRDRVARGCPARSAAEIERRWIHSLVVGARVPLADAEDVTQEVWLALHAARVSLVVAAGQTPESARRAFCCGVVRRQAASYRRARANRVPEVLVDTPDRLQEAREAFPSAESLVLKRATEQLASRVLAEVAEERRAVLVAYEIEDEPMMAVAERLGIPTNTAWNRLRLARADVRGILRRRAVREGDGVG